MSKSIGTVFLQRPWGCCMSVSCLHPLEPMLAISEEGKLCTHCNFATLYAGDLPEPYLHEHFISETLALIALVFFSPACQCSCYSCLYKWIEMQEIVRLEQIPGLGSMVSYFWYFSFTWPQSS
ncbi:vomeronasal type-1 receptor 3-like [Platysternon megacephalum]|uniref:Vomeronasal type-1 receptor 3-like n=1 Tax=Platysternon megacephalum TaxID=55544 RepID=A0A4D9E4J8_9SAUR|nr:vomeronasal type-1 receptor 3-like [Platysternon megacephalum]